MSTSNTSEERLAELVLYVAKRCQNHYFYGKIKLNKILFYSDVNAFTRLGRSITGETYKKQLFGPVPKRGEAVIAKLVEEKAAVVQLVAMPDTRDQHRVLPLREPDLATFSGAEIAIVEEIVEWVRPMSAQEISDLSHETAGWRLSHQGEDIPYGMALLPDRPIPLTASEIEMGCGVAKKYAASLAR